MRQFVLPGSYRGEDFLQLSNDDFHYLVRVLRLAEGDSFPASDGRGGFYHLTLDSVGKNSCRVRVQTRGSPDSPYPELILFQCLPKGRKFDTIVRQATELGVSKIVPVESRFSVPKIGDPGNKAERWSRIAREAAQQSGAASVPEVAAPVLFKDIPSLFPISGESALGLFFHQAPLARTSLHEYLSIRRDSLALVIGPEGGLADEEIELLRTAAFAPVYLGPTVLRTETAPVFAMAAVEIIILENKAWEASDK